jgi:hypothetical protein
VAVDVRIDEIVLHALEKEPQRRYQHASEVKTDVETVASSPGGAPQPQSQPQPQSHSTPFAPAAPAVRTTSDKTILPAFLLAFFLGFLGVHRFYVGKTGTGIAQLLTFGGCGIWSMIDWILILCKAFTDKEGRRLTEWVDPDNAIRPPRPTTGVPGGAPAAASDAYAKVRPAAIALMAAAGLKLFSAVAAGAMVSGAGPLFDNFKVFGHSVSGWHPVAATIAATAMLVPAVLIIIGAVKMLRFQSYNWSMAAAIMCIVFPPLHIVGIPVGIWALVVLTRDEVKSAFGHSPSAGGPGAWTPSPKRVALIVALAILAFGTLLVAVGVPAAYYMTAQEVSEKFNYSLAGSPEGRIVLENVNGRIDITSGPGNEVLVSGVKRSRSKDNIDATIIEVESDANHVRIRTREPKRLSGWFKDGVSVDYTVQVPEGVRLENVSSVNGKITITGVTNDIEASTVNGSLQITGARANIKASTVNGKIGAQLASVRGNQNISLEAVNGELRVTLPEDASVRVAAETQNGRISSDFALLPVKKKSPAGSKITGSLGDGEASLNASTVNGTIKFRKPSSGG